MKFLRRTFITVPAVLSFGALLPAGATEIDPTPPPAAVDDAAHRGEAEYLALPALPQGGSDPGAGGVSRSAIRLAAALRAVPAQKGSTEPCPEDRLVVGWDEPGPTYGHGAFVDPLGPAPTADTTVVNGVVLCTGSDWAFMGFEAEYVNGRWDVVAVPFVDEEVGAVGDEHEADRHHHAAPAPPAPPVHEPRSFSGAIDAYARYEPQRTCSSSAKPGTIALQRLLMGGAPGSRNLGISRACHIGGSSEHKEGRAFDWGVLVHRPAERAAADAFLARLLATDDAGNRHALARRMGVMYVIWNQRIWSAYRPNDGWRPYSGRSPHTDHVHISLSWDGALGRTSYWSGQPIEALSFGPAAGQRPTVRPATAAPSPTTSPAGASAPTHEAPTSHDHGAGPDGARNDHARKAAEEEARRAQQAAEEERRRQQKAAEDEARRVQQAAEEEARRAQKAAEEQARRVQQAAEEEARRAQKAAEEEARRAQKAAEEQARRAEQAARDAERRPRDVVAPNPAPALTPAPGGGGGKGRGKSGR